MIVWAPALGLWHGGRRLVGLRLDVGARLFRAALGFLQLPPRAPELRLLHRWLDTGPASAWSSWASSGGGCGSR
jgi:hypothetical protein